MSGKKVELYNYHLLFYKPDNYKKTAPVLSFRLSYRYKNVTIVKNCQNGITIEVFLGGLAIIQRFYITLPEYRNKGYGKTIMWDIIRRFQACNFLQLDVACPTSGAVLFYKKHFSFSEYMTGKSPTIFLNLKENHVDGSREDPPFFILKLFQPHSSLASGSSEKKEKQPKHQYNTICEGKTWLYHLL
jgi:hypothetical protein